MKLDTAQTDRAAGVLLGQAVGDALGVPYEFATPPAAGEPAQMLGGGLGNFSPGEWSDDTAMAVCIAEVAATGEDLTSSKALDAIAEGFLRWHDSNPADIGVQTKAVLSATSRHLTGGGRSESARAQISASMTAAAADHAARSSRSAGNGALMRTSVVALASLDDPERTANSARAIANLTHHDELAADSCVIWSETIRIAVLEGRFDFRAGVGLLPRGRRSEWNTWIDEALTNPPGTFTPNGFTVTALQAAIAAIAQTEVPEHDPRNGSFECLHLQESLHAAVRIGYDTDTVAAIAGGLLGARWGASAIPWQWRRKVHGWPGLRARDLVAMATHAVQGGRDDDKGWPGATQVRYDEPASSVVVPHPFDDHVLLGTMRATGHAATAVVSMCRVGTDEPGHKNAAAENRVESRLMDSDDLALNPNLHFALYDVADAIRGLRHIGHTVLVHCVAAQQRTPSAAVAYAVLRGQDPSLAQRAVREAFPGMRGHGPVWEAAIEIGERR